MNMYILFMFNDDVILLLLLRTVKWGLTCIAFSLYYLSASQLYQILDIVRNLLLAPPTQESLKRSQKRSNKRKKNMPVVTVREHRLGSVGKVELHTRNPNESSPTHQNGVGTGNEKNKAQKNKAGLQVVSRHDRHTMRHGIENFISAFQTGTLYPGGYVYLFLESRVLILGLNNVYTHRRVITEVVRVEYYIGRCTCRLMMSPQYILSEGITDKVEVGMTGFGAKHSYMSVSNAAVYQDVVMQVRGLIKRTCTHPASFVNNAVVVHSTWVT